MPQVPYSPIPQAGQMIGTPKVSVNTPEAAFGGNIGQALQASGKMLEGVGDEVYKRAVALQELQNETEAKNGDAEYMKQSANMLADFKTRLGENAGPEALAKHNQDLDDLRLKIRAGLSTDSARKMYDASSLGFMGREVINAAVHASGQQKTAADGASQARITLLRQNVVANPNDDVGAERGQRSTVAEVNRQADLRGYSEAQRTEKIGEALSTLKADRIEALAEQEPGKAQEMLDRSRQELFPADVRRVERVVEGQIRNAYSRNITNEVTAHLSQQEDPTRPEKSVEQQVKEGVEKAEKVRPNDAIFKNMVEARIREANSRHKSDVKDFQFENQQRIAGALNGNYGGKPPTTPEELVALDPRVAQAWKTLDDTKKHQYMVQMAKNAKGDVFETPETIKRYLQLRGMAQRDGDPVKFMEMDPSIQEIPFAQRRALGLMQEEMKKKPQSDPRVNQAMSILKPNLLEPARITHDRNPDQYNQFVGALQDALEQYQQESKKLPDFKKTMEIGQRLLIDQSTHWYQFKEPLFNVEVPSAAAKDIEAGEAAEGRPKPTPELTKRIYVREIYKELYGGKDSSVKKQDKR